MGHPTVLQHHTKDKGDKGVGFVLADCLQHGVQVCLPMSEHLPFDLILVSPEGDLARTQVKFISAYKGAIRVDLRSLWSDRNGPHRKPANLTLLDALAIYNPDTGRCYYLKRGEFKQRATLRIKPPKNTQMKGVRLARDFVGPARLFAPIV